MFKFRSILILFLPLLGIYSYPEMDPRGNYTENFLELQGRVNIELNSMSYKQNEPVYLDVTVKNFGTEVIRLFPTNDNFKTFQFMVTDEDDNALQIKDDLKLVEFKSTKTRTENMVGDRVKEIIIHKNESFQKRFDLAQFYNFIPGKKYYVTAYFYPNYLEDKNNFTKSENQALLQIEKRKIEKTNNQFTEMNTESSANGLSPEEIIYLFLGAEMKKNWANYFKYIHFPEFILGYTKYANEYANAEDSYKDLIVDEFKKYLTESKSGTLSYYKITSTEPINPNLVRVFVQVDREQNKSISKFSYQYTLKKTDDTLRGFWKISSVIVRVKK